MCFAEAQYDLDKTRLFSLCPCYIYNCYLFFLVMKTSGILFLKLLKNKKK